MNKFVKCAFNQMAKITKCVAYCKLHKCYLTQIQIKSMNCLQKQCKHLNKIEEHKFWIERKKKKLNKKNKLKGIKK